MRVRVNGIPRDFEDEKSPEEIRAILTEERDAVERAEIDRREAYKARYRQDYTVYFETMVDQLTTMDDVVSRLDKLDRLENYDDGGVKAGLDDLKVELKKLNGKKMPTFPDLKPAIAALGDRQVDLAPLIKEIRAIQPPPPAPIIKSFIIHRDNKGAASNIELVY